MKKGTVDGRSPCEEYWKLEGGPKRNLLVAGGVGAGRYDGSGGRRSREMLSDGGSNDGTCDRCCRATEANDTDPIVFYVSSGERTEEFPITINIL